MDILICSSHKTLFAQTSITFVWRVLLVWPAVAIAPRAGRVRDIRRKYVCGTEREGEAEREGGPGQTLCWSYDSAAWPAVVVGGYCFLAMALPSLTSPEWRRGSAQFAHLRRPRASRPHRAIPSPETHIAPRPGKIRPTRTKGEHKCCNVAGHERVGAGGATLDCPARADSISQIMGDEEGPDNADRARV